MLPRHLVDRLLNEVAAEREQLGRHVERRRRPDGSRLDALGPAPRAELLHVLTLPDYDRAGRIGEFFQDPRTRTFADLLIDAEEDPYVRAVLVGMLRE